MDWRQALEVVVSRTRHERYRDLCADGHPDRETWRRRMVEQAAGTPPTVTHTHPGPPTPAQMAARLGHALFDWAVSGFSMATDEERARRLSICGGCDHWDGSRCRLCGCYTEYKTRMKTEHCPVGKW